MKLVAITDISEIKVGDWLVTAIDEVDSGSEREYKYTRIAVVDCIDGGTYYLKSLIGDDVIKNSAWLITYWIPHKSIYKVMP